MNNAEQREIWKQQMDNCYRFFDAVADELKDTHVVIESKSKKLPCKYLVKKGQEKQVSYYGKPVNSLRVGSNWNWRAGLDRCANASYIQCVTPDLPYAKRRSQEHPTWSTHPIYGNMVALFDTDNKYHCVFGEKFDFNDNKWVWVENVPQFVAKMIREKDAELEKTMNQK